METDVIRWARQAGFTWEPINNIILPLERFAAIVAAAERDAILKMSNEQWFKTQADFDAAIRARGQE